VPRRGTPEKKAIFHAKALPRFSNTKLTKDPLKTLEKDLSKLNKAGYRLETRILMSFGTDPYNNQDVEHVLTREAIKLIIAYGLSFCVLTKGGSRALRDIDLFRTNGVDEFATTLTCFDDNVSSKTESGAALPSDRMNTIREFHNRGIKTWVSLEPILHPNDPIKLIKSTWQYVDEFRIGKLNYRPTTLDYKKICTELITVLSGTTSNYMFKEDLWPYLPSEKYRRVEAKWNKYSELSQKKWSEL
jgi:DNA repair photolyase